MATASDQNEDEEEEEEEEEEEDEEEEAAADDESERYIKSQKVEIALAELKEEIFLFKKELRPHAVT